MRKTIMSQTIQEKNKALVLEAFDTLFNKRDYAAAEKYWSPNYIQHSAHIEPGRDGLFNLIKTSPPSLRYEHGLIMTEGDFVVVHGRGWSWRRCLTIRKPAFGAAILANVRGTVRTKSVFAMANTAGIKNGILNAIRRFAPSAARGRSTIAWWPSPVRIIACGSLRYCFNVSRRLLIRWRAPTRQTKSSLKIISFSSVGGTSSAQRLRSIRPAATSAKVSGPTALSINSE